MSPLAQQQQALLQALFAWPADAAAQHLHTLAHGAGAAPQRGLMAYQSNGHLLAQRALAQAYPVVAQLLGEESFADLARALWHAHPPLRGDMACWGDALPAFLRRSAQLQDEPYLPDVAQAEWHVHSCATEADRVPDLHTLAWLTTEDPQTLALQLAPGLAWVCSAWPVASIWLAHTEGTPTLAQAGAQLRQGVAQDVVVWRQGLQPRLRQALPGEGALLQALQDGVALEPALERSPALDFSQWLPLAVQTGLVLGVARMTTERTT